LRTWYILVISQVKKCPALRGPWRANRKCDVKAIASGANPSGLGRGVQRNDGPVFKTKGGESFRAPHCRKERYSPARRLTIAERLLRCRDHDQLALCRPGSLGVPAPGVSDFEARGSACIVHSAQEYRCEEAFEETARFLQSKGLFESLAEEFETAKLVHEKMDHLIHRDTKDYIRRYVEEAGLEIRDWCDSGHYTDSVVVLRVIKPFDPASALALRPGRRVF
jgi:hypothetical protein